MAETGITLSFSVTGDEATAAKFEALPLTIQKRVLAPALRAAAKLIQGAWKANVRSRSGATRAAIKVRAAKRSRKNKYRVTINAIMGKGDFKGQTFYAAAVELGWKAGSRKEYPQGFKLGYRWIKQRIPVKGKKWKKRAKESTHNAAQALIIQKVREGIEREAKALGR